MDNRFPGVDLNTGLEKTVANLSQTILEQGQAMRCLSAGMQILTSELAEIKRLLEGTSAPLPRDTANETPCQLAGDILRVLTEAGRPLKGAVIAAKLKRHPTSHFYGILRELMLNGRVLKTEDGLYKLSS